MKAEHYVRYIRKAWDLLPQGIVTQQWDDQDNIRIFDQVTSGHYPIPDEAVRLGDMEAVREGVRVLLALRAERSNIIHYDFVNRRPLCDKE